MLRTPVRRLPALSLLTVPVLCFLLLVPPAAFARQSSGATAMVNGAIADGSGGALAGASVEAVVARRVIAATASDTSGAYRLDVPAGVPLEIRVRLNGFADETLSVPGFTGTATRNVTMQLGRLSDTLVVTASRGEESRTTVTAAVSVITAADIAALGSPSLADAIRHLPGVNVESTGREGAQASLFSRGGESDYNLVLIDGVRVNQSGGAFDFSRVAAGEIERIEVVRGAQSSLYGSDAMGAVVQVFTRRTGIADAPRLSGEIEGGSFGTWRGTARVTGGALRRVDYQAGVSHRRSDGAFEGILTEPDRFEHTAFDGTVGLRLGSRASLRSGLRYSNGEGRSVGQFVYGGGGDTGSMYDTKDLSWHLDLSHAVGQRYTGTGTVNVFRYDAVSADTIADPSYTVYALLQGTPGARFPASPRLVRLLTPDEFAALAAAVPPGGNRFLAFTPFGVNDFPFRAETTFRRPAVKYQGDFIWAGANRLSAGYEFERESTPAVDEFSLTNNAAFIQQQFSARNRWFATVGARIDSRSKYDTYVSPRLSAGGYLLPPDGGAVSSVKAFANVGRGLKIPTFTERFGAGFADGNPDLQPERVRSVDVGAEATFFGQRLRGSVAYFDNSFQDLVEFRSTSPSFSRDGRPDFINIAGSEAHGVEVEAALQRPIGGLTASATYSLVSTQVESTVATGAQFQPGQPLLRRPRHSGGLRVSYRAGSVAAHLDARFVGERHDASFLTFQAVPGGAFTDITVNPGYAVTGAGVEVQVRRGVSVFLRVDNLGDTAYESALGFPGMPRSATAGARFDVGR